ncbi:adenylate/guanylate cyclase domain-containing protein [uncultured Tateyamaria sp.]|uniref:adenylate/guanylate cyclase domain-containing protein n=1 Tax=uncultured Tateyamaria sp. TaxID=455651 RepID=UPI002625460E|nr:adenylate/guanylate cyclase domain-containing protein [uncultured Tateyamaria sp.]
MIKTSPELLAVARRWYEAVTSRRPSELANFMSKDDAVGFVGSAHGEMWFGPAVRQAIGAHFNEIPKVEEKREVFAQAFENGQTGWTFFAMEFKFETRPEPILFHSTLVFVLEEGAWKIVFRHTSVPTSNMDSTGHEHSAIQALVEAAQKGFSLGQREGLASVMFTDIVGSSTLGAALGDRVWSALVGDHFAALREIIEDHGGQFVKSLGDGTMSSFASARRALAAAQAIQRHMAEQDHEPRLDLRIGLHTGDVVQSDDDFFGSVVNKAARITASAGAGDICVSDVTKVMVGLGGDFTFDAGRDIALRGFEGAHKVFRLGWQP